MALTQKCHNKLFEAYDYVDQITQIQLLSYNLQRDLRHCFTTFCLLHFQMGTPKKALYLMIPLITVLVVPFSYFTLFTKYNIIDSHFTPFLNISAASVLITLFYSIKLASLYTEEANRMLSCQMV